MTLDLIGTLPETFRSVAAPECPSPRVVRHGSEPSDRDPWNDVLLQLPYADLRQGWEWGELRRTSGWIPHRYAVFDGPSPVAAISITARRVHGIAASVLYASRGPAIGSRSGVAWSVLKDAIADVAASTRAIFLRVSPAADGDGPLGAALLRQGFVHLADDWTVWNAPRIVMTLDVTRPESELKRRMRQSTQHSLLRALKYGVVIDHDVSTAAIARFHQLLVKASRRTAVPVRSLAFFEALRQHYLARDAGCLLLATHQGTALAGLLAVRFGSRVHLLYSAVDTEHQETRTLRPGTALHWELIRWARASGCEVLDWGGSGTRYPPRREDPGFGVFDFKVGFGCVLEYLPGYYDLVFRPSLYRVFRTVEERLLPIAWKAWARLNR
jgi:peptidoglycan pentaglycine glycine transferase (the first glycine)